MTSGLTSPPSKSESQREFEQNRKIKLKIGKVGQNNVCMRNDNLKKDNNPENIEKSHQLNGKVCLNEVYSGDLRKTFLFSWINQSKEKGESYTTWSEWNNTVNTQGNSVFKGKNCEQIIQMEQLKVDLGYQNSSRRENTKKNKKIMKFLWI